MAFLFKPIYEICFLFLVLPLEDPFELPNVFIFHALFFAPYSNDGVIVLLLIAFFKPTWDPYLIVFAITNWHYDLSCLFTFVFTHLPLLHHPQTNVLPYDRLGNPGEFKHHIFHKQLLNWSYLNHFIVSFIVNQILLNHHSHYYLNWETHFKDRVLALNLIANYFSVELQWNSLHLTNFQVALLH